MSERTPAEAKQELNDCIEMIRQHCENNISENVKRYIFGGTKVQRYVRRVTDYALYFNNVFSLAFIFAYGCLRCDNDGENPLNLRIEKQNSMRIVKSLKKAYVDYPVTSELIQFVLADVQFEVLNGGKLAPVFSRIFDFGKLKYSLSKYYSVISTWRAAPSRFSMDGSELAKMFLCLINGMKFLYEYDLVQNEDGSFTFVNKHPIIFDKTDKDYVCVPASNLIYYNSETYLEMYSLYAIEKAQKNGKNRLGLHYVAGDGFKSLFFTVGEDEAVEGETPEFVINESPEDYYYNITGTDWSFEGDELEVKKNDNFIDQVHAINYKYTKNLALAISDTMSLNSGSKRALYNAYHKRHKDIFKEVEEKLSAGEDIDSIKVDWDAIVVMLLIESSPTSVLETLFCAVDQTFIGITANLCRRIDNPDIPIYGKGEEELRALVDDIMKTKLILGEAGGFGKIPGNRSDVRLRARARALLVVSSLSAAHNEETTEKAICAGNIYDNIALLRRMRSEASLEQCCKYTCIILGETFRHLLCFYRGLIAYGEEKAKFDAESCNRCFTDSQLASYQKQMNGAFMEAAKVEAQEIAQSNSAEYSGMTAMLSRFIELCENCSSSSSSATTAGYNLYSALGKHEILNLSEFRDYTDSFVKDYTDISESNVDAWIEFALEILRYLRLGNFRGEKSSPFKAIYPFTATYNRGNENYDGYKTVTFALNINNDGDERTDVKEYINVLSEFSYNLTNVFYCLPNVLRSNTRWWIDPVLISFKDFNDIFVD